MKHLWRSFLAILIVSVLIGLSVVKTSAQSEPMVVPVSPINNSNISDKTRFSFMVNNLPSGTYESFWAVDNGTWNRMTQFDSSTNKSSADIDISGWNWNKDNDYTLSFIALQKSNWEPIITKVHFHIGNSAPVQENVIQKLIDNQPTIKVTQPAVELIKQTASQKLFADPSNSATVQADNFAKTNPEAASKLAAISTTPVAKWFGNWTNNVQNEVNDYVTRATESNSIPMLVAYNIPQRDCGGYSAGGARSAEEYSKWITAFGNGIGKRNAIIILEPDSLASMNCLNSNDQSQRLNIIKSSVDNLSNLTSAKIYLDGGNPTWQSAQIMASRLKSAGIDDASGFSLNVSNFYSTSSNIEYGSKISDLTNNSHFVIDTSRNGKGAPENNEWCNPSGRSIGQPPTLNTGNNLVDAFMWVKQPGESDGNCGPTENGTSALNAGIWWPQYALSLVENQ